MKSKLQLTAALMALLMVMGITQGFAQTEVGKTDTPPVIDGTKDAAWDAAPGYLVVDPTSWSPNAGIQSDADFSLTWSALWDATNLYIYLEFMDDVVTAGEQDSLANSSWMNDNAEVGIGPYMYRFSFDKDDDVTGSGPEGFTQKSVKTDDGYVVEVMVPWATLINDTVKIGENPDIDTTIAFSVVGADLDDPDGWNWDQLEGHLQWPKGWTGGEIILVAAATIDDTPPSAPANLKSSYVTFSGATLSWDAVADADLVAYMLYNGTAPYAYVVGATELMATLAAETSFSFTVKASDGQNLSDASNQEDVTTPAPPQPVVQNIGEYTGTYSNPFEDFDVWDAQPRRPIIRQATPGIDPSDHSAEFSAMWDATNLYIKTYVLDDIFYNESVEEGWKNDAVEYHFDMNNERNGSSTDSQLPPYESDNFQYRAVYKKPELQTGSTPAPDWTDVAIVTWDLSDADFKVVGYYIEATFPWSTLNKMGPTTIEPAIDVAIGFDLNSGDTDTDPEARKSMTWSSIQFSPHANTSEYGQLVLKADVTSVNDRAQQVSMLSVYPNPTADVLHVNLPEGELDYIQVKDMLGRTVINSSLEGKSGMVKLDLSQFAKGVYFVTVTSQGESLGLAKFIKK